MLKPNARYKELKDTYLFNTIYRKTNEYLETNPDKQVLRMGVGAVDDGVEIVGDHEHRALVSGNGIFQGDLGEGIQVAGGFVQQQKVGMARGQLGQLQQILFTAGELTHPAV